MTTAKKEQTDWEKYNMDAVLDYIESIWAAEEAGKSDEEIHRMSGAMPLFPKVARGAVMRMGKKRFLEEGYDRTMADAEYGEQWIDEVDDERFALTGMRD